jgi:predicted transcriptional regulator
MQHALSKEERERLKIQHKQERDKRVCDRIKAVLLRDEGWTHEEIAHVLLLTDAAVRQHVSDYQKSQKRVWIRGEGSEWNDFDETCCNFFGDGDPILKNYQAFGMTDAQYAILKKFRDAFRLFADASDFPEEFIDTPEWEEITRMAKAVLQAFEKNVGNKRTDHLNSG